MDTKEIECSSSRCNFLKLLHFALEDLRIIEEDCWWLNLEDSFVTAISIPKSATLCRLLRRLR
jgi:hypothetical protein